MSVKKIVKYFTEHFDNYVGMGNHVILKGYDHVLYGFYFEKTSIGVRIWEFKYPLFDYRSSFHLLYSRLLETSKYFVSFDDYSFGEVPNIVLHHIHEKFGSVRSEYSLREFCSEIESDSVLIKHPNARASCGLGYILLGNEVLAKQYIVSAFQFLEGVTFKQCQAVLDCLDSNPNESRDIILAYENNMISDNNLNKWKHR